MVSRRKRRHRKRPHPLFSRVWLCSLLPRSLETPQTTIHRRSTGKRRTTFAAPHSTQCTDSKTAGHVRYTDCTDEAARIASIRQGLPQCAPEREQSQRCGFEVWSRRTDTPTASDVHKTRDLSRSQRLNRSSRGEKRSEGARV